MPRGALLPSLLRYLRAGLPLSACARQPSLSTCILEERSRKEGEGRSERDSEHEHD